MRLNKKVQYGLIFCFHLADKGKANVPEAAKALGLSVSFLQQVARKLARADLLISAKGPYGGYILNGNPPIGQIIEALSPTMVLSAKEQFEHTTHGGARGRFAAFALKLGDAVYDASMDVVESPTKVGAHGWDDFRQVN